MHDHRPRRGSLRWALPPKQAMAAETGLSPHQAGKILKLARARVRSWKALVVIIQFAVMVGWIWLISTFVGINETVTTFEPDGTVASEITTGPFGITVFPLFFGLVVGPLLALVLGALAGLVSQFLLVDRETRRCARTPECFGCGDDRSAVGGTRCPECGLDQPHLACPRVVVRTTRVSSFHD